MTASSRPIAQDIGLFLVLALFANLIFAISAGGLSARDLLDAFYLIAFVHIAASFYDGIFDHKRTITWVIFILGWTVAECASFAGYVIPKGQLLFWLASDAPWAAPYLERLAAAPSIVPTVLLALLAIDVLFAYQGLRHVRTWSWIATLIVLALVAGPLSGIAHTHLMPPPPPKPPLSFDIVPSWHLLPYFSLLRAIPDKTIGVIITSLAILAPVAWPWTKPGQMPGAGQWLWLIAWLAFVAAFLGLGYLGAQPPQETVIGVSRILAVYYFAFLLVIHVLIRRLQSRIPS